MVIAGFYSSHTAALQFIRYQYMVFYPDHLDLENKTLDFMRLSEVVRVEAKQSRGKCL